MDDKSNIISFSYHRRERDRTRPPTSTSSSSVPALPPHEQRIAQLEDQVRKLTAVLVDVAQLSEKNRENFLKLLRLLQEKL